MSTTEWCSHAETGPRAEVDHGASLPDGRRTTPTAGAGPSLPERSTTAPVPETSVVAGSGAPRVSRRCRMRAEPCLFIATVARSTRTGAHGLSRAQPLSSPNSMGNDVGDGSSSGKAHSRPSSVQMQTALSSGSASTTKAGERPSSTTRPPAATAAAIRSSATSGGTVTSRWKRCRSRAVESVAWNHIDGSPWAGSTTSLPPSRPERTAAQNGRTESATGVSRANSTTCTRCRRGTRPRSRARRLIDSARRTSCWVTPPTSVVRSAIRTCPTRRSTLRWSSSAPAACATASMNAAPSPNDRMSKRACSAPSNHRQSVRSTSRTPRRAATSSTGQR